jgi:hypothetical protein
MKSILVFIGGMFLVVMAAVALNKPTGTPSVSAQLDAVRSMRNNSAHQPIRR